MAKIVLQMNKPLFKFQSDQTLINVTVRQSSVHFLVVHGLVLNMLKEHLNKIWTVHLSLWTEGPVVLGKICK